MCISTAPKNRRSVVAVKSSSAGRETVVFPLQSSVPGVAWPWAVLRGGVAPPDNCILCR